MRKTSFGTEKKQIRLPKDYPFDVMKHLTDAQSDAEVLRSALSVYFAYLQDKENGKSVLVKGSEGDYAVYRAPDNDALGTKKMNATLPATHLKKIDFICAATGQSASGLVRDALVYYKTLAFAAAFERPVYLYDDKTKTNVVLRHLSLDNAANAYRKMAAKNVDEQVKNQIARVKEWAPAPTA